MKILLILAMLVFAVGCQNVEEVKPDKLKETIINGNKNKNARFYQSRDLYCYFQTSGFVFVPQGSSPQTNGYRVTAYVFNFSNHQQNFDIWGQTSFGPNGGVNADPLSVTLSSSNGGSYIMYPSNRSEDRVAVYRGTTYYDAYSPSRGMLSLNVPANESQIVSFNVYYSGAEAWLLIKPEGVSMNEWADSYGDDYLYLIGQ